MAIVRSDKELNKYAESKAITQKVDTKTLLEGDK